MENLTPSRRFLLMWLLPLASGFACGCFAGSLNVSGPLGSLAIAATGGFAVWLLSFFLLPEIPSQPVQSNSAGHSAEELRQVLIDRYADARKLIGDEGAPGTDTKEFQEAKQKFETRLAELEIAVTNSNHILIHDKTKDLLEIIDNDLSKFLSPDKLKLLRKVCYEGDFKLPKPDPFDVDGNRRKRITA